IREAAKRVSPETVVIGEVWEDASTKESYGEKRTYFLGKELDGVMNYPFRTAILNAIRLKDGIEFKKAVLSIMENYPKPSLDCCMSLIGTHDTVRIINELAEVKIPATKQEKLDYVLTAEEKEKGVRRLKMASAMQFFLPGVPTVYYGDEIGMDGFEDPINRRPYAWNNQNAELLSHYVMLGKLHKEFGLCDTEVHALKHIVEIKRGTYKLIVDLEKESFDIVKE
ncbi:MAG: glycoside hydrolase family 13 protein, partial [Clostridia bacterium]|nr:glycoside hydrolase family 13 protein [Clostridia bacterium]